jgi:hypothetical protein
VLQVIEIVRKLRRGTRNVAGVSGMDLCPTSNSRLQEEASTPKRNISFKKSEILRTFRSWSDNTHFTPEDIPELWKLIQARLSKNATDARYTRISLRGPDRSFAAFAKLYPVLFVPPSRAAVPHPVPFAALPSHTVCDGRSPVSSARRRRP